MTSDPYEWTSNGGFTDTVVSVQEYDGDAVNVVHDPLHTRASQSALDDVIPHVVPLQAE